MTSLGGLSGNWLLAAVTVANAASMAWFGYDQVSLFS